ncbi:MAG: hypothetical protein GY762_14540 [Proteobacteria bacterium]|nr:hypothetical protein [Pseudomonadota bacterium]
MSTFKRVLLYAGMVISIVMLVLAAAALIGTWVVNTPATEKVLGIVVPITETLQGVERLSSETGVALDGISAGFVQAEQRVEEIGDEVNEANVAVEAISALVGEDITPKLDATREGVRSIYDTLSAIQGAVQSFNAMPFLDLELPGDEELGQALTGMEEIVVQVQDLNEALQNRKEEIVSGAVDQVSQPLDRLETRVSDIRARLQGFENRTGSAIEQMLYVQENAGRWIDMLSIIITLILIWFIISQVAMFVLCRGILQGAETN